MPSGDPATRSSLARARGRSRAAVKRSCCWTGFHGTASAGPLGVAASHGCMRMAPVVIDLFERVTVGTPVLAA